MTNVVDFKLVKAKNEPDPAEIAMLEDMLARVKAGAVRSLGLVALMENEDTFVWIPGNRDKFAMLGAITDLSNRFHQKAFLD